MVQKVELSVYDDTEEAPTLSDAPESLSSQSPSQSHYAESLRRSRSETGNYGAIHLTLAVRNRFTDGGERRTGS